MPHQAMLCVLVFLASTLSRLWHLDHPSSEELHTLQHLSLYMKQRFFLDEEPPLGKFLLVSVSWWQGWDGDLSTTKIEEYPHTVPIWSLRVVPALFGSLLAPLSLLIVQELQTRTSKTAYLAFLAPLIVIADSGLVIQSRLSQTDSILLCFMAASVFSALKLIYTSSRNHPLCWYFWLLVTGFTLGVTISTDYMGLMTAVLVIFIVFRDLWRKLPDQSLTHVSLVYHFLCLTCTVCFLPICIYISIFYIHLSILNSSGSHDHHMTSAFQASLKGGLSSLIDGQPHEVVYGSQITIRRTHGAPCWLHSHEGIYPHKYPDGRLSSFQQQVSCIPKKDVNNWWIVKHPHTNHLHTDSSPVMVRHGDIVQLVHGMTRRALHSHDVAAPVTYFCQEVSCYIDYGISDPAQNLWQLEIVNRHEVGDIWRPLRSEVRLVHMNTSHVLKTTGAQLPEWGGYHYEVASDKVHYQTAAVWNVEEHRYTKANNKNIQDTRGDTQSSSQTFSPTEVKPDLILTTSSGDISHVTSALSQSTTDSDTPQTKVIARESSNHTKQSNTKAVTSELNDIGGSTHQSNCPQPENTPSLYTTTSIGGDTPQSRLYQSVQTQVSSQDTTSLQDESESPQSSLLQVGKTQVSDPQDITAQGETHRSNVVHSGETQLSSHTDTLQGDPTQSKDLKLPGHDNRVSQSSVTSSKQHQFKTQDIDGTSSHKPSVEVGSGHGKSIVGNGHLPPVGFWTKFVEVQQKMWYFLEKRELKYEYSAGPLDWVFCTGNVLYWKSQETNAQIPFVCNVLVWLSSVLSVLVYTVLLVCYLLGRKRHSVTFEEGEWEKFVTVGWVCVCGYLLHFLPYFLSERMLFPHQYLPALFYSMLLLPLVLDHLATYYTRNSFSSVVFHVAVVLWLSLVVAMQPMD